MKFSVRIAARKWPCSGSGCGRWPVAALAAVLLAAGAVPASAYLTVRAVPLPQPRPAEAPAAPGKPAEQKPAEAEKPATDAPPAAPVLSACRQALTENIAVAPSIPPITGPGDCGGEDLVRLEAVVLPDNKGRVAVKPAAVLRCTMASAVADWIRTDMAPLAEAQGSRLRDLDILGSFECRGRNGVVGAKLSEHGHANALDVGALNLASGTSISLTDRSVPREVRETVLHSVCTRFTTVLGPGSDGYHEDHIHLDLAERHNGYRICQWEVWDPLPAVAPLLPAERPEQAPPREVAEKVDAKPAAAPPEAAEPPLPAERPEQAPRRQVAEKADAKPAAAPRPEAAASPPAAEPPLPAERPEQAPRREVAEKADAKPAAAPQPEAAAPPAATRSAKSPKADHPKPKPRRRRRAPGLFGLFGFR
jgi:hypothetical protein